MFGRRRLGEVLMSQGRITQEKLNDALHAQQLNPGKRLGEILIEKNYIEEIDLIRALGLMFGFEVWEKFDLEHVDISLSANYNYSTAMSTHIIPFQKAGEYVYTAACDPLDINGIDYIRALTGCEPVIILSTHASIRALITSIYDRRGDLDALAKDLDGSESHTDEDETEKIEDILNRAASDDEGPIIQLINMIFQQAVREHASDIHIEAAEEYVL
ncbi:MAG: hypothetical protein IIY06_07060, partial [Proteobacteria bacterium]|nr:hypothetical protein [Pseudomonadota bacterium]